MQVLLFHVLGQPQVGAGITVHRLTQHVPQQFRVKAMAGRGNDLPYPGGGRGGDGGF
ncbi:hypothetical protein [Paludibacterium denitrificans]|uniref:hypothetical protein n=1 Tax=Paludibacterium denitrificans TaxID=2675226 RepID=UPI00406BB359